MHKTCIVHLSERRGDLLQQAVDLLPAFTVEVIVQVWFVCQAIIPVTAPQMTVTPVSATNKV